MALTDERRILLTLGIFVTLKCITSLPAFSFVRRSPMEIDEFDVKNCSGTDYSYCNSKGGFQFSPSPCDCKCTHDAYSYVVSENRCISNWEIQDECKFAISKRVGVSSYNLRPFVLPFGRTRVYYCRDASSCEELVSSCAVSYNGSSYDGKSGWIPLWSSQPEVVFGTHPSYPGELAFTGTRECEGYQYDGMLLRLQLTCRTASDFPISSCLVLKVASIYEFGNPDGDEPIEKTACTKPSPTTTTLTTDPVTTSSLPASTTPSSSSTMGPTGTEPWTTVENNVTTNSSVLTTTAWKGSTARISTGSSAENTALLIVVVILAVVLFFSCIVIACLWTKWKGAQRKQRRLQWSGRINPYSMHFLDSRHRPSDIFLVEKRMRPVTPISNTVDLMNAADQPYNEPMDSVKPNAFRHVYAAVDKLRRKSKMPSTFSLDEGYTSTEDIGNYNYRKFSAFPRDLYDSPGEVVPNEEPDYRIPEDFIARIATPDFSSLRRKPKAKRTSMENLYDEPNSPTKSDKANPGRQRISRTEPRDPLTREPIYYEPNAVIFESLERKRSKGSDQPPVPPRPSSLRSQRSHQNTIVSTTSLISDRSDSPNATSASESSEIADG